MICQHYASDEAAAAYAAFRPRYPAALFDFLAGTAPARRLAWDCATGNGQAALGLAAHFARVVATDASAAQIGHAFAHPRVAYHVAQAEASGLAPDSCDLVTVAQALHWFAHQAFFAEVQRVLVPGGVLAAWTYVEPYLAGAPDLDAALQDFAGVVDSYWPPERRIAESGYRGIAFPFAEVAAPTFHLEMEPTLDELCGYLRTWSATLRYVAREGRDPALDVEAALRRAGWTAPDERRPLRWPIHLRVGRRT